MHWIEILIYVIILLGVGIYVGRLFWISHKQTQRMKQREIEYAKINKDAQSKDQAVVNAAAKKFIQMLDEGP